MRRRREFSRRFLLAQRAQQHGDAQRNRVGHRDRAMAAEHQPEQFRVARAAGATQLAVGGDQRNRLDGARERQCIR